MNGYADNLQPNIIFTTPTRTFNTATVIVRSHLVFIPVLRILDIEANRFYGGSRRVCGAVLLAGCCARHALLPFVGAGVGHQGHFIKIPFIYKGMDL